MHITGSMISILYIDNIWIKSLNVWYSVSTQWILLKFTGFIKQAIKASIYQVSSHSEIIIKSQNSAYIISQLYSTPLF